MSYECNLVLGEDRPEIRARMVRGFFGGEEGEVGICWKLGGERAFYLTIPARNLTYWIENLLSCATKLGIKTTPSDSSAEDFKICVERLISFAQSNGVDVSKIVTDVIATRRSKNDV